MPRGFKVINTRSMNIVEPDQPVSFVALSYMWAGGGAETNDIQLEMKNLKDLETPGSLTKMSIPNIILDTILLCRDLGESYIWVDRLCIIQDDTVTKPAQIAAMDRIYRSASFTIVAASNDRYGTGIPGYNGRPRSIFSSILRPPRNPEVEGRGMKPNGMKGIVNSSLWNKRGWTFQERVLSKRRLFITEHQVIFECAVTTAEEELTWNIGQERSTDPAPSANMTQAPESTNASNTSCIQPGSSERQAILLSGNVERSEYSTYVNFHIGEAICLRDYCNWAEDYSSRQLSFGSDILNAFAGVGNILSKALGTRLLYGLPEKYLAQTLMWSCHGTTVRRGDVAYIPSWSWASSLNPADYHWLHTHKMSLDQIELLEIASIVEFYFQDPTDGFRKLEVEQRWEDHNISIAGIAAQAGLPPTAVQKKRRPGDWRSDLIWKQCPHNPWTTICHSNINSEAQSIAALFPGSLVFNTTVASLKIQSVELRSNQREKGDFVSAAICAENGEVVGRLNQVSRDWIKQREGSDGNKRLFDFVVICGALEDYNIRKWLAFQSEWEKTWRLYVMMVERLPCKPFVARRVEVGQIWTFRWKDCNPRWETVVLC